MQNKFLMFNFKKGKIEWNKISKQFLRITFPMFFLQMEIVQKNVTRKTNSILLLKRQMWRIQWMVQPVRSTVRVI